MAKDLRNKITTIASLLVISFVTQGVFAADKPAAPPERADQEASSPGFSTWDIQALYGGDFREPGVHDVEKVTATLENTSGWSWGSSYFFIDYLRSGPSDQNATEFYGEWYPSVSLGKMFKKDQDSSFFIFKDLLVTTGVNAGAKTTGAAPLVFLPGFTFDLKLPLFQFFSLGVFAYIDQGRINGVNNGCNSTTYQIGPSWSLPIKLGRLSFRFDGFIDFIGKHGQCVSQVVAQPTIKLDLGDLLGNKPNRLYTGVEVSYWKNKYGISGLNQTATQGLLMWTF